ncbi:SpoIIE family protein phosphatase [Aquipuribacter sp. MA13-6]|uniref:SpoIIE family protein phosphatase n=1 Tax=unclassified Aquipuribacter TaxID=2635084 RepID=UPI003EE8CAA6
MAKPAVDGGTFVHELFGAGETARALAAVDWAGTPLGPTDGWPRSLTSIVRALVSSRFSMWMAWGPELTFLCNDAYRRDTLGAKYPWALGRPAGEVWAEIWPEIWPRIDGVMTTRRATWDEALMLFLERHGYREETYHTFSYSPLTDDDDQVVGMLCVVSEETERVIGAKRMALVRDLGARVAAQRNESEVLAAASRELSAGAALLPFTLTYLTDEDTGEPVLAASTGVVLPHAVAPRVLRPGGPWPLAAVQAGGTEVVTDLGARFTELPTGGWPDPPQLALLVPFRRQDDDRPVGFLVAGLNPYQALDADHRGFVELVAGQVAAALHSARAYQDERRRAERLLELDRAKTDFFTNVSHEFRTPLTLMLGPTDDALADVTDPLAPVQRERLEIVRRNGARLLRLVDTLLDFSRVESGTAQARFEAVDLGLVTAELAHSFRHAVERVGLSFDVDCPPLPRPVLIDREMWARIVLNLLSNALKFTFSGGVAVRLVAGDDGPVLTVTDTGAGISAADQVRLFDRFVRVADARSRSFEGSGIGLALVADLTALHGGRVELDSAPGRGSTFTVTLPWGAGQEQGHGTPPEVDGTAPAEGSSVRGFLDEAARWLVGTEAPRGPEPAATADADPDRPTVLVVDDNADMRDYVGRLLASEHDVLLAADGRAGLELARAEVPDLVLSDVMMPELDGFGLLAALRSDPRTMHVPVVLVSARSGEDATVLGLDSGADDYLAKPFSSRELLARVRANLELERVRRTRRELERMQRLLDQAQRLARVGSWELDLASGSVSGSTEFLRQIGLDPAGLDPSGLDATDLDPSGPGRSGFETLVATRLHPDDREWVREALLAAADGAPLDITVRLLDLSGEVRSFRTIGEAESLDGSVRLRGSIQDVTEQLLAEEARATAAAATEVAAREHRIADELQRSLLPAAQVEAELVSVASFYSAGAEGTQVGGDWYDVIELGGGRTALVVGDVMGRGVPAAAVMGQLRSAVRAFARLDLPPTRVLEHLDGVVRDLGDDQIVTCLYAVHDPYDASLTMANAGHLPPLVRRPGGVVERLQDAQGPPLGTAVAALVETRVTLEPGAVLVLYTDGLVEDRGRDIDDGIDALTRLVEQMPETLATDTPAGLVATLLPRGADDDIALLMAQIAGDGPGATLELDVVDEPVSVRGVRRAVAAALDGWGVAEDVADTVLLLVSELVTNALLHGRPPVQVRVRRSPTAVVLEVHDDAQTLPRRDDPGDGDEHGRGLQLVSALASRWGTRPTVTGKAVWCTVPLDGRGA